MLKDDEIVASLPHSQTSCFPYDAHADALRELIAHTDPPSVIERLQEQAIVHTIFAVTATRILYKKSTQESSMVMRMLYIRVRMGEIKCSRVVTLVKGADAHQLPVVVKE